ncbi:MAG: FtsW/RodA/SpoVE family cell cycle protein, partial [Eubacterium sp.]|nr:FtsW/RodA/SpoVE family cell cycle protein [Eubacterium sp.]
MVSILVEISKYILLLTMVLFTAKTYMVLQRRDEDSRRRIMRSQIGYMVLFNLVSYMIMYAVKRDINYLIMLILVIGYILIVQLLYRLIYKKAS